MAEQLSNRTKTLKEFLIEQPNVYKEISNNCILIETGINEEQRNYALKKLGNILPFREGKMFYVNSIVDDGIRQICLKYEGTNFWQVITTLSTIFDTYQIEVKNFNNPNKLHKELIYICRN